MPRTTTDVSIPGRSCAIGVNRITGKNLEHCSRDTEVRLFKFSPETAMLQIRLDAEKSHTYAWASLDVNELKALRAAINSCILELEG